MAVTFYPSYFHSSGFTASAEPSITVENYTSSGAETTGPAYDLVDNNNNNVITIGCNGAGTAWTIDMDLSANITAADFAILDNHNLNTASATVEVDYGGTKQTLTAAYEGTLGSQMAAAEVNASVVTCGADGITLFDFSGTRTASGFEFKFDDQAAGNFQADVTIGEALVGVSFSPSVSPDIGVPRNYEYGVDVQESYSGQKYAFERHGLKKSWRLNWRYLSAADKTSFEALFAATKNSKHPFYIDLGETAAATPTLYFVRFVQDTISITELTGSAYSVSFTIEEVL